MFVHTAEKGSDLRHKGPSMLLRQRATSFYERRGVDLVVAGKKVGGRELVCHCFGGINYQIEHHLFPSVNHVHLPRIAPIVR